MSAIMQRTRILHVVSSLSTYGAERLVAAIAQRFPADEFDVRVMTVYRSPIAIPDALRKRVIDINRSGRWDTRFFGRMVAGMRAFRPDIVHTHVHNGKYWGRLAALAAKVPVIVHTEHNGDYVERGAVDAVNRVLHGRTKAIVAFSPGHAERIATAERVPPERFRIIPNGILDEPERYARERVRAELEAGDRALVLRAARFEPPKAQALAVDAWAASPELRRRALLVFAGTGVDEAAVRARAWGLGLDDSVKFLGYRKDVPELLGGIDVMLMSSHHGEAMPLIAIEAMRAGVPIVSTPWPGADEFFRNGSLGIVTADHDAEQLAAAVLGTLDDPDAAAARAAEAHQVGHERYGVDACVRDHAAMYRELLSARTPAREAALAAP